MRYERFVDEVRQRAGVTEEEAAAAVAATLETLGERLDHTERSLLAAQLPNRLKGMLQGKHRTDRYSLAEFYNRVRARAEVGYPEAIHRSRVVAAVLLEAVSEGEMNDVLSQLPKEYEELFGREPATPLSPTTEEA
jgi:uncharacterized protein (DUF2267 family)